MKVILTVLFLLAAVPAASQTVTYAHDAVGRLIKAVFGETASISYFYDVNGNLLRREGTGSSEPFSGNPFRYRGVQVALTEDVRLISTPGQNLDPSGGRFWSSTPPTSIYTVDTGVGRFRVDASIFSIDQSLAQARNTAYYNGVQPEPDPGIPVGNPLTSRTFRYLALPRFPEGLIEDDKSGSSQTEASQKFLRPRMEPPVDIGLMGEGKLIISQIREETAGMMSTFSVFPSPKESKGPDPLLNLWRDPGRDDLKPDVEEILRLLERECKGYLGTRTGVPLGEPASFFAFSAGGFVSSGDAQTPACGSLVNRSR